MQLSKRLLAIAKEVPSGSRVADVGCDHAYTSIYLAQNNAATHIIAMDVKIGPLKKAQVNIEKAGLTDVIETRLSDGVMVLNPGEVNAVVISGMGGLLVNKILDEGAKVIEEVDSLILQPQKEIDQVRKYIHEKGFQIIKEIMLIEEEKYYTVIVAKRGTQERFDEVQYQFGKYLLEKKDSVLEAFLRKEEKKMFGIIENLKKYKEKNGVRIVELEHEYDLIHQGLDYFDKE